MDLITYFSNLISSDDLLLKMAFGLAFGVILGLTGVGGGVLLIPILQIFFDLSLVSAVGTASLISALVKVNASIVHIKAGNISWHAIGWIILSAAPVTFIITRIVIYYSEHQVYQQLTLNAINTMVVIVMGSSLAIFATKLLRGATVSNKKEQHGNNASRRKVMVSGAFCGSVLGATGIGGGVIILPVFNSLLNIEIKKAIGSSVLLALLLSFISATSYMSGGVVDLSTVALFVLGSFVGVPIASLLLKKMTERSIYLVTTVVIAVSLVLTIMV